VRNSFTPANVRLGEKQSVVTVECDDRIITATRGKSISSYSLGDEKFTKTGRQVPPEITEALSMPLVSDKDVTFNFQFDKPFLLDEPGARVAAILGSLTNVSLLHAAGREANRRRLESDSYVKAYQKLLEDGQRELAGFPDLEAEERVVEALEGALADAEALEAQRVELGTLIGRVERTASALASHSSVVVPTADWEALETYISVSDTVRSLETLLVKVKAVRSQVEAIEAEITEVAEEYGRLEKICPTCGQSIQENT